MSKKKKDDIKVTVDPNDDESLLVSFTLRPNFSIEGKPGIMNRNGDFIPMDVLKKSIEKANSTDQLISMGTRFKP